ncbi:MAG: FAD-dependent oxidoreductase [Bryobacteraceae bacterium]
MRRLVVVGNGRAADAFLRQMHQYKHDFAISVFGDGPLLRDRRWYADHSIDLSEGVRVVSIDRHARVAQGGDGSFTTYDRLILAIGMPGHNGLSIPGLQMRNGLIVNRAMETTDGYIYAIGGCAEVRDTRWAARLDKQAQRLAARLVGESDGVDLAETRDRLKLALVPRVETEEMEKARIA